MIKTIDVTFFEQTTDFIKEMEISRQKEKDARKELNFPADLPFQITWKEHWFTCNQTLYYDNENRQKTLDRAMQVIKKDKIETALIIIANYAVSIQIPITN